VATTIGCEVGEEATELASLVPAPEGVGEPRGPPAPPVPPESLPGRYAVAAGVALYAGCSSTLLVINKVAVSLVPDASFVLFWQFLASCLAVRGLRYRWPDMDIELLEWDKVKKFAPAMLVFYICLLANTQALKSVNVETVIVVRSCSPVAVALLEHAALGQALPSCKAALALAAIAAGATVYVLSGEGFHVKGYAWLSVYFVFIVVEMVFVKFVIETVQMSTWTRVYYKNTLSLPLALLSCALAWDGGLLAATWSAASLLALALSSGVGVAISYATFNLLKLVSATSFAVIGVVCKVLTVLINDLIWTQHSNLVGHLGLLLCILAGVLYERAKAEQRALQAGG